MMMMPCRLCTALKDSLESRCQSGVFLPASKPIGLVVVRSIFFHQSSCTCSYCNIFSGSQSSKQKEEAERSQSNLKVIIPNLSLWFVSKAAYEASEILFTKNYSQAFPRISGAGLTLTVFLKQMLRHVAF